MFFKKKEKVTKLTGGYRNVVLLKEKGKEKAVEKHYREKKIRKRLLRDVMFHTYNPFSPKIKHYSKDWMKMDYIPDATIPTLKKLLGWNNLLSRIAYNLKIMHSKPVARQIPEAHVKNDFDYRLVLKKFLSKVDDHKFKKKLLDEIEQFNVLNKEEDFGLIHGDFWLNNIIVAKEVFAKEVFI